MTKPFPQGQTPILPVHGIADELVDALSSHSVVVVEGATGCGKTTQIPQILMDRGLVADGMMLGVTQPRRIAAISVADRIAQERGVILGTEVGYSIRFYDVTSPDTRIKVMTDGLLLREARSDGQLSRYGLIMVDEAHERTLNIDFTLGLLHQLLQERDDLKVVISSATISPTIFTRFFNDAPHLRVEARAHPVEIQYKPMGDVGYQERISLIASRLQSIHRSKQSGDVLVFLTGEQEIKMVIAEMTRRGMMDAWIVPLYGRLKREEQEQVFHPTPAKYRRKIVLSTNIAETSLTIDGIRTVVDLGLAKVPSYNPMTGLASLTEEPISKAACRQRSGRAGRTAPGTSIRLFSKESYRDRLAFEIEEVKRVDLTDVVLRLVDLGVSNVQDFPFITPPPKRLIRGAVDELRAMDAIDSNNCLTDIGRSMVPFPLSARLGRMIVEASQRFPDIMDKVLAVGAFLSIRSPYLWPQGEEDESRKAHQAFASPHGDLVAALNVMDAYESTADQASFCERNYLDPHLMSEMLHIRDQLTEIAGDVGLRMSSGGSIDDLMRCVLVGLPRHIACRQRRGNRYETATGIQVSIHPGSCLNEQRPHIIVAAECVATRRAWARTVSAIRPEWVAELYPDLARRWNLRQRTDRKRRRKERPSLPTKVTLGGEVLPIRVRRGVPLVDVPWTLVQDGEAPVLDADVPPAMLHKIHARLMFNESVLLSGWPLVQVAAVAPHLRLAEPALKRWPDGELLTAEREMHHIIRYVPDLLRLARVRGRRKLAFLTLVQNAAGGYWFEGTRDLGLALEQSMGALDTLLEESVLTDADEQPIQTTLARLHALQESMASAYT